MFDQLPHVRDNAERFRQPSLGRTRISTASVGSTGKHRPINPKTFHRHRPGRYDMRLLIACCLLLRATGRSDASDDYDRFIFKFIQHVARFQTLSDVPTCELLDHNLDGIKSCFNFKKSVGWPFKHPSKLADISRQKKPKFRRAAMGEAGEEVLLYVYDLTGGMAKALGESLLQKPIEGIWHTAIVVFGKEHFFGSNGISVCSPGTTALGSPLRTHSLGKTCLPEDVFQEYLRGLEQDTFSADKYNLLRHNCNNFSNEISQFLCGNSIPEYILNLPDEILSTPFGKQLQPVLEYFSNNIGVHPGLTRSSSDFESLNNDIDSARKQSALLEEKRIKLNEKLEKRDKRKKKKKNKSKHLSDSFCTESGAASSSRYGDNYRKMSENGTNGVNVANGVQPVIDNDIEDMEKKELELKRKERDPPIVFQDTINVQNELERLVGLIDGRINPDDMQYVAELDQYMLENEGSWALGEGFLSFVGRLLNDDQLVSEVRETMLNILAAAALKDDIILVLHQDRREHILMNYANGFDKLPLLEQLALALFMCNLFEHSTTSEWLLYISEWQLGSGSVSNIRVTTKVAVNSLLSEDKVLQDRGTALVHNLACKEVKTVVFDDVVVELAMAVLQYFNSKPDEEHSFRCMKSLARFCQISRQDVPQLVQMIGPPPSTFKGMSNRIDEQIAEIQNYLR
ncbi:uncharacterized protein LOC112688143 isoform X3 [Sipha flava]|uniref:Uncharacterized protein LOC112688143 isoform X3 n=1 Tax=Sipha flava TaxID=143950 RepID=A0A8B8G1W2_9HEMI|nr:uncharacterized protein LOC112688143 isoform X3 [Sipha flava]